MDRQPQPMKFLTLADWTGMVETELFAQTYKSYGLTTVRYPVLEVNTVQGTPYSATYSYVANSPLVSQIVFQNNGSPKMTIQKS